MKRNSRRHSVTTFLVNSTSALALAVFGDFSIQAFSVFLESQFGLQSNTFLPILILFLIIIVILQALTFSPKIYGWLLSRLPWRRNEVIEPTVRTLKKSCRGLIVLASKPYQDSRTPAEEAIYRHINIPQAQLEYCWIICTDSSIVEARKIREKYQKNTHDTEEEGKIHINCEGWVGNAELGDKPMSLFLRDEDSNNSEYIQDLINLIYKEAKRLGLEESEIIADFTGGTKAMTAGMVLACVVPGRRMEYFSQLSQDKENQEDLKEISLQYEFK